MATVELKKPIQQQFQNLAGVRAGLQEAQAVVMTALSDINHSAAITKGDRTGKDEEVGLAWDALHQDPDSGRVYSWLGGGGFEFSLSFDESLNVTGHVAGSDEKTVEFLYKKVTEKLAKAA